MKSPNAIWLVTLMLIGSIWGTHAQARYEDPERLRSAVRAHILGNIPDSGFTVSSPTLERKLTLPACPAEPETFDPPGGGNHSANQSRRTIGVRCPGSWTLYVPTQITRMVNMVTLARPVGPGHTLSAADLQIEQHPISSMPLGYVGSLAQAIGQISRQPLAQGARLRPTHLRAGNAVTRGQDVRVFIERAGMHIESRGAALADGAIGAWVKVKNLHSGRIVEGRVESAGVVRIP